MTVVAAIREAIAELRSGTSDPTERVPALLAQIVAVGRDASPDVRRQLLDAVAELHAEVGQALDRIGDELKRTGTGRAAMSGYGAIRPHTTAQRFRTRI